MLKKREKFLILFSGSGFTGENYDKKNTALDEFFLMRVLLGRLYTERFQAFSQLQTPLNLCIFPLTTKCLFGRCLHSASSRVCSPGQTARVHLRTTKFICTLWPRQIMRSVYMVSHICTNWYMCFDKTPITKVAYGFQMPLGMRRGI